SGLLRARLPGFCLQACLLRICLADRFGPGIGQLRSILLRLRSSRRQLLRCARTSLLAGVWRRLVLLLAIAVAADSPLFRSRLFSIMSTNLSLLDDLVDLFG